ncbi:1646_t:CDS:1, partial [Racocetra fulgida]
MGKKNFKNLYKRIKSELGDITCKISYFSDNFDENKNYAGMIVYAVNGNFAWNNTGGKASGYKGRSFYVVIQCTNNWPSDVLKDVGNGQVHHHVIKSTFGFDYNQDIVCCGGFSYHNKQLKFSSLWLNGRSQEGWESDGSKYLSRPEQILVEHCFEEYKKF